MARAHPDSALWETRRRARGSSSPGGDEHRRGLHGRGGHGQGGRSRDPQALASPRPAPRARPAPAAAPARPLVAAGLGPGAAVQLCPLWDRGRWPRGAPSVGCALAARGPGRAEPEPSVLSQPGGREARQERNAFVSGPEVLFDGVGGSSQFPLKKAPCVPAQGHIIWSAPPWGVLRKQCTGAHGLRNVWKRVEVTAQQTR